MTPRPQPRRARQNLEEILAAQIQVLGSPYRHYRVAADRFLAFLQTDFPHLHSLSELRRDPHLLGWIRGLCQQDPPLSHSTRRMYLTCLRRLLRDLAPQGQHVLILPEDFPPSPPRPHTASKKERRPQTERPRLNESLSRTHPLFGEIFDSRIRTLATTFRPDIVAGLTTTAQAARYDAWTSAFTLLLWNSIASPQPQNEERLAGQGLPGHDSNFDSRRSKVLTGSSLAAEAKEAGSRGGADAEA
jgi:hypothetical protein